MGLTFALFPGQGLPACSDQDLQHLQGKELGVEAAGELQDAVHLRPHLLALLELRQDLSCHPLLRGERGNKKMEGSGGEERGGEGGKVTVNSAIVVSTVPLTLSPLPL